MHALRLDSGTPYRTAGSGPCYILHDWHKVEAFEDTCQVSTLCMQVVPHATGVEQCANVACSECSAYMIRGPTIPTWLIWCFVHILV